MSLIFTSIVPIILTSYLGYRFNKKKFLSEEFWQEAEKLAYFVLLPSLFFKLTYLADLSGSNIFVTPAILITSITIITTTCIILRRQISKNNPNFTSLYQGSIRFNSYILIALAYSLFGEPATVIVAILVAILVPIINLFSIYILTKYGTNSISAKQIIYRIITNPLLNSCVLGMAFNYLAIPLPDIFIELLDILSRAALPLGLLCVGAAIDLKALNNVKTELLVSSFTKLILFPILTLILTKALMIDSLTATIAILFSAIPAPASSYILAKQFGGNTKLMANIVMAQTLFSSLTIPLILVITEFAY